MNSQNIVRRSATNSVTPAPQVRDHQMEVAKLIDVSICIGCKACQVACNEWNDLRGQVEENVGVYDNPSDLSPDSWTLMRFTEHEDEAGKLEWLIRKDGCMHCEDPGCLKACPVPGAIVQYANGIVDFQSDLCVGCGYCVAGCPFDVPRISKKDHKAYKCTLCSDRVTVGQAPACAKTCPTGAIAFGSKQEMKDLALSRIEDLNERGYENAGLYDPQGVGGTHVMYVLQHADDPQRYAGLPKDPQISSVVDGWKDVLKPAAAVAGAVAVAGMAAHFIGVGPNSVDEDEEHEHDKATQGDDHEQEK
ncbi:formate dehydrogenase subunit beta [Alcaligenes aquatilis]|jgi:formate dehydrogenase iron-sulfur subunit|uniref:formate dehydrogenase subunit beta n=1 Tax=Alcaligenes TaxID=507 RepID=UPI000D52AF5C|nr:MULTISPECIES: formate dehydrogenase subunit beta [Alcaligenes]AWG35205.1 formate dehydrogenase subunit beta [Alcaligenes aquatilis]MCC9161833.1 formate dehydrogenase subunit beta [Alcaligenes sp. MMA]MCH4224037.1 formate dehydrogenase subunit beta [Alcaligenes faecalis]QXR35080.1 formate dehydrogenase subunit beta [Alcaligenes aquatilis]UYY86407.1 formate dehydrogenase subunit beta [Alcaligenes sp. SMD-FA]